MSQIQFRDAHPVRTYAGNTLTNYRGYKPYLLKDFNERCGYTDCHHSWFGGKGNFQIDHFKCKSKHPGLETTYSNLVYSCSYVNRAKSNDEGSYIDPCETDYNEHFFRDEMGNIYANPKSESAKYMYKKLKLYLRRYSLIWTLERVKDKLFVLEELIKKDNNQSARDLYVDLNFKFHEYLRYLRAEQ